MSVVSFDADWIVRPKVSIFAQLGGAQDPGTPVRLPHDALITLERAPGNSAGQAYFPGGAFEYVKEFDAPVAWEDKRVAVEFGGVYRDAVVFVNDAAAAHRPYGYSGMVVELNPFLRLGQRNTIRVEARAEQDSRWYTGAGIYRHTRMVVSDLVHIPPHGVRVTTPDVDDERAVVEVAVDVRNSGLQTSFGRVAVDIKDDDGTVVARGSVPITVLTQGHETARIRLYVDAPRLWSVDSPELHHARVTVTDTAGRADRRTEAFGIRTLRLDPRHGLRINGETVKLRGACVHHDNGILGAANFARAEERKVQQLKAAGFNAIRSAHNPLSAEMLDACDRHGMLVMDESFDIWTESKTALDYSLSFPEWWERDIEAMVAKDFNHPSVIMYSIGNEIPETGNPFGAVWGRRLADKVRALDSTRFVTNGINGLVSTIAEVAALVQQFRDQATGEPSTDSVEGVNDLMATAGDAMHQYNRSESVTTRTAESFGVLDIAGMNYGDARYESDRELFPNRIIVGSETFVQKIAGNWELILASPNVIGDFTWTGYDYLGEVGIGRMVYDDETPSFEGEYPWIAAWCGDLDLTGLRRPQSYYREIVFGLRADPYIAVQRPENFHRVPTPGQWAWSDSIGSWTWQVEPGSGIRAEVYADADEVELLLDGEVIDRRPVGEKTPLIAEFELGYARGELVAVAYRDGVETGRSSLRSAEGPTRLTVEVDRSVIDATDGELAFVAIELRDAVGTVVTCEDRPVTVTVAGSGRLHALGSARPVGTERYNDDTHTTFDGRALAVIRPEGVGEITVTAAAEGLAPATVTVSVRNHEKEHSR